MDPIHLKELQALCLRIEPVGSRITCNPPPMDTDEDFLMLFQASVFYKGGKLCNRGRVLADHGYHLSDHTVYKSDGLPDNFMAFRKGIINLITTTSVLFYNDFMLATNLAKHLNILEKTDRIELFENVFEKNLHSLTYMIKQMKILKETQ